MAFNRAFQSILSDTGSLALGCYKASIDSSSIGDVVEASFQIASTQEHLKVGYPLTIHSSKITGLTAVASLTCFELGAIQPLLSTIADSLHTGVVPIVDLSLEVFKPVGKDISVSFSGAALLQEFNLEFNKTDFNSATFTFEQLSTTNVADNISVGEAPTVENKVTSQLLSVDNISIGLPKVGGFTALGSASLNLSTEYERLEVGYPLTLRSLTPLEHEVTLEITAEEFTTTNIGSAFSQGAAADLAVQVALYDGSSITFTIKNAILAPGTTGNLSQKNWSTLTKKFIGTGPVLLTIT